MGLFDFLKGKGSSKPAPDGRVEALMKELHHVDAAVRLRACRQLMSMGHAAAPASELLHELLNDSDGDVCNAAAAALSEIDR